MIIKQYGAWIFVFSPLEKKFLWISTDLLFFEELLLQVQDV